MKKQPFRIEETSSSAKLIALCVIFILGTGLYYLLAVEDEPLASINPDKELIVEEPTIINDNSLMIEKGKALFLNYCAACHAVTRKMIGPALSGVVERWSEYEGDIYRWIQNSEELIDAEHPKAIALRKEWELPMPPHNLSIEQIDNILAFIESES